MASSTEEVVGDLELLLQRMVALSVRASARVEDSVSTTQLRVLRILRQQPDANLATIAEELAVAASSASRLIDRLVAAGLVDRRPSTVARREVILNLTRSGESVLRRLDTARRAELQEFWEALADAEQTVVRAALPALTATHPLVPAHAPDGMTAGPPGENAHHLPAIVRSSGPTEVVANLLTALRTHDGVLEASLLLADYRLATLLPLEAEADPVDIEGTPAGRAFSGCIEVRSGRSHYLPLTNGSERLGVICLRLDAGITSHSPAMAEIREMVATMGLLLREATRGSDILERGRRQERLTLPAETQWSLLPGRVLRTSRVHLAGHLEPAYSVSSDAFDWSASAEDVSACLIDVNAEHHSLSPVVASLAIAAIRNNRRSGHGITKQLEAASAAVWDLARGRASVEFAAVQTPTTEQMTASSQLILSGGVAVWRLRSGRVAAVTAEPHLPLGLFEDSRYAVTPITLQPGDRLLLATDGMLNGYPGRAAGLRRALRDSPVEDARELVRRLCHHVQRNGGDDDDATLVILDVLP